MEVQKNPPSSRRKIGTGRSSAHPLKGESRPFPLSKGGLRFWAWREISQLSSTFSLFFLFLFLLSISSCTKDGENPFDDPNNLPPEDTTQIADIDPTSFVGLHQNIFKPTCANSGCHDGSFEPDFRTIESAYNTLVLHPLIKNNPSESYTYRVKPGSLSESVLWLRLNEDIDGISGIMPLDAFYDPESAWNAEKAEHLSNISDWILNGAKDMFGNEPGANNQQPGIYGVYAESDGIPCSITDRINVSINAQQVSVFFAVKDLESPLTDLQYSKVKMSGKIDFADTTATEYDLELLANPITQIGFQNNPTEFQYTFSFPTASFVPDSMYYMRVFLKDPMQTDTTQIPQDGSQLYIKKYFSWKFVN